MCVCVRACVRVCVRVRVLARVHVRVYGCVRLSDMRVCICVGVSVWACVTPEGELWDPSCDRSHRN